MNTSHDPLRNAEPLESLLNLAQRITGRRPSPSTVWRWCRKGTRAGRLNAVLVYGQWHSTASDLREFLERRTAITTGAQTQPPPVTDDGLRAAGLL